MGNIDPSEKLARPSPDELTRVQRALGLSDGQFAILLGTTARNLLRWRTNAEITIGQAYLRNFLPLQVEANNRSDDQSIT